MKLCFHTSLLGLYYIITDQLKGLPVEIIAKDVVECRVNMLTVSYDGVVASKDTISANIMYVTA